MRRHILSAGAALVAGAALSLGAAMAPSPASAVTIGIAIDESGSIGGADFTLQRDAYVALLGGASNLVPTDGTVAIMVVSFSSVVETVFPLTTITNAADLAALNAALAAMTQQGGQTAIGDAITVLATAINAAVGLPAGKTLIDVSTDGANNRGENPVTAAANAVAGGIDQVNCLGVGIGANCGFIAGLGAFSLNAVNFAAFEDVLDQKLTREIIGTPEPMSLALFGLGLAGLGVVGRRQRRA